MSQGRLRKRSFENCLGMKYLSHSFSILAKAFGLVLNKRTKVLYSATYSPIRNHNHWFVILQIISRIINISEERRYHRRGGHSLSDNKLIEGRYTNRRSGVSGFFKRQEERWHFNHSRTPAVFCRGPNIVLYWEAVM